MPIYEYQCEACGERFDKLIRSIRQAPVEVICPVCHSPQARRLMSAPAKQATGTSSGKEAGQAEESPSTKPPVFGRKELNQAMERKRQLKAEVSSQ